jgi:hypothetical protein
MPLTIDQAFDALRVAMVPQDGSRLMAIMLGAMHRALVSAGANDEDARKAAEELAGFEKRLAEVEANLMLLKWIVGSNIVISLAILWKVILL